MSLKYLTDDPLEEVDTELRFYDHEPQGPERYVVIDGVGVLWTDDRNALQLGFLDGADNDAANELRRTLVQHATNGLTASTAFDLAIADYPGAAAGTGQHPT